MKTYISEKNIDLSESEDQNILVTYEEELLDGTIVQKYAHLGLGPFTFEARKEILEKLLTVQSKLTHPEIPTMN